MKTLLLCMGLPASGKSTWARAQVEAGKTARVNRDNIRKDLMPLLSPLGWDYYNKANEDRVTVVEYERIGFFFTDGYDTVIVDDTNLSEKTRRKLGAVADSYGANVVIKRFETNLETCIKRDAARMGFDHVGEEVLRRMAKLLPNNWCGMTSALHKRVEDLEDNAMPAVICDLDGTLALHEGIRNVYDATRCAEDKLNTTVRRVIETYYRFLHYQIIYLSGRDEQYRAPTMEFLRKHTCPPGPLYMRPAGDTRKDFIIKGELFNAHVRDRFRVDFILDDRNQVVEYWRSIGLTVFQVANGAF